VGISGRKGSAQPHVREHRRRGERRSRPASPRRRPSASRTSSARCGRRPSTNLSVKMLPTKPTRNPCQKLPPSRCAGVAGAAGGGGGAASWSTARTERSAGSPSRRSIRFSVMVPSATQTSICGSSYGPFSTSPDWRVVPRGPRGRARVPVGADSRERALGRGGAIAAIIREGRRAGEEPGRGGLAQYSTT